MESYSAKWLDMIISFKFLDSVSYSFWGNLKKVKFYNMVIGRYKSLLFTLMCQCVMS